MKLEKTSMSFIPKPKEQRLRGYSGSAPEAQASVLVFLKTILSDKERKSQRFG